MLLQATKSRAPRRDKVICPKIYTSRLKIGAANASLTARPKIRRGFALVVLGPKGRNFSSISVYMVMDVACTPRPPLRKGRFSHAGSPHLQSRREGGTESQSLSGVLGVAKGRAKADGSRHTITYLR